MDNKVNLFLIGVPKCGTTSLANYLSKHDEIFLPEIKEPHFFAIEHLLPPTSDYIQTIDEYYELYDFGNKLYKYWLDASVWYYSNKEIAKKIYEYNPFAKICIIIRNPFEALRSLFIHRAMAMQENCLNINQAIKLADSRKQGENIPVKLRKTAQGLFYVENYLYSDKIENYYKIFGNNNVKVLFFDDLVNNKKQLLDELLSFLSLENKIDPDSIDDVFNRGLKYRNKTLNKTIKILPRSLKRRFSYSYRKYIDPGLNKIIPKNKIIDKYDFETIKILTTVFNSDIEALEKLVNKDLKIWKKNID